MKKFASLAAAGAMLLSVAVPAFAWGWSDDDVNVRNRAYVRNTVETEAETGDNEVHGKFVWGGRITTGAAEAGSDVLNDVNYTNVGCNCVNGDVDVHNRAYVRNYVETEAETGDNEVHGMVVAGGKIRTGYAGAGSMVTNLVNTTVVGGVMPN